jgi:spoIIIJ-associated protein
MPKKQQPASASDFILATTQELFSLLSIEAKIEVSQSDKDGEKTIEVNIEAPDSTGLLIGAHGSTLAAIQVFLGMALRQQSGEWNRVVVNIGDWQEKQEEQLSELAQQTASRALSTGEAQRLYNLSPSQRRIIHLLLAENDKVQTESQGEGAERHLIISPKA